MPLERLGAPHPEHLFAGLGREVEMRNPVLVDGCARTGSELAAELYEVAARLAALGEVPLSPVALFLHLQAVQSVGTPVERKATVDLLAGVLGLAVEVREVSGGSLHYSTSSALGSEVGRVDVCVYTGVPS